MKKVYIIDDTEFKLIANSLNDLVNMCNTHIYNKLTDKDKYFKDTINGKFREVDVNYLRKFTKNNTKMYLEYQDKYKFNKMALREFFDCKNELERKRLERENKKKLSVENQFIIKSSL